MPQIAPPTSPTTFAPLPVPTASPLLQPIRRPRRSRPSIPSSALIPLFQAALLFLAGIVFARFLYLRPGLLLASLLPLGLIAIVAIMRTPRLAWLPIGAVWLVLGAWSAETERLPALDPFALSLSDGLWPRPIDQPTGALLFEAIDVGQGDSLLLITPDGK